MDENLTPAAEEGQAAPEIRMATIAEIFEDGVTLIFDGQEEASEKHYKCNTSAALAVGDRVMLDAESGTYIVAYAVGNPRSQQESHELPTGGTNGQALLKDGADDYTVKWGTIHQLPSGGSTGQVLKKTSDAHWAVEWSTPSRDVPSGGTDGQVLLKDGATSYVVKWGTVKGLPAGGALGQVLKKKSAVDYDVVWGDAANPLPTGGTDGQVLTKNGATAYAVKWADAPNALPSGGSTGQVLMKSSATNYAVKWGDVSNPLPTGGSSGQVLMKSSATNYAVKWGDVSASALASGSYKLTLSGNVLAPSSTGFSIGTSGAPVKINAPSIVLYYSSYKYCTLTCNSSGKLAVNGTQVG